MMRHGVGISAAVLGLLLHGNFLTAQEMEAAGNGTAETPVVPAGTDADPGVSTVRIVRLSEVRGVVHIDRNVGRGMEDAFANIPITQGTTLETGVGIAEIELEDNSTLRLTPNTSVTFPRLSRDASGNTLNTVNVTRGMVYVSLSKAKGNAFLLQDARTSLLLTPGTHLRLEGTGPDAKVAVFTGSVQVTAPASPATTVAKNQTLVFDPQDQGVAHAAGKPEEQAFDRWDTTQAEYHTQKASFAGSSGSALYGANDLNYYGSFANLGGGCGSLWRPYFASAAWDPFANGTWALYGNAGYSWVSPYPWGWLPFHSGQWQLCGANGWGWRPGGAWHGLSNQVLVRKPFRPFPTPGSGPKPSLVPVNEHPLASSGMNASQNFTFRKDSAGMGVPRSGFGALRSTSSEVAHHGEFTHSMAAPAFVHGSASSMHSFNTGAAGMSHAGSAMGPAGSHMGGGSSAGGGHR